MTTKSDQIRHLEITHNVFIDPDTMQFNRDSQDAEYGWEPIPSDWLLCECCGLSSVSDEPEIAEDMLCDSCYRQFNKDEIIGYRKGE